MACVLKVSSEKQVQLHRNELVCSKWLENLFTYVFNFSWQCFRDLKMFRVSANMIRENDPILSAMLLMLLLKYAPTTKRPFRKFFKYNFITNRKLLTGKAKLWRTNFLWYSGSGSCILELKRLFLLDGRLHRNSKTFANLAKNHSVWMVRHYLLEGGNLTSLKATIILRAMT